MSTGAASPRGGLAATRVASAGHAPAGDRRPRRRKAPRSVPSQVALSPNVLPAPHFAVRGPLPLGSLRRLRSPVPSLPLSLAWKQRKVAVARANVLREGPPLPPTARLRNPTAAEASVKDGPPHSGPVPPALLTRPRPLARQSSRQRRLEPAFRLASSGGPSEL